MTDGDSSRQAFLNILESEQVIDGRFEKVKRIDKNGGNGCFSLLFKARDKASGKKVALKFFDPSKYDQTERVERFYREGRMLDKFSSEPYVIGYVAGPCKVQIKIVHEKTGLPLPLPFRFIAMDLADSSLEHFIYEKKFDVMATLLFFKEAIKAAKRVHRKRTCHRDLKPSNFLIDRNEIRLSDLGTAKCMDGTEPALSPSYRYPIGELNYTAPEAMFSIGIGDEFVYLSDIFSMGAIMFEMFTQTVLTNEIYGPTLFNALKSARQILSGMTKEKKIETYKGFVPSVANSAVLPDIYSFNDNVPSCIKHSLNSLYKNLAAIDFTKRLHNETSIHRQLDICILILKNEKKYTALRQERKMRREQRFLKQERAMQKRRDGNAK